MAHSAEDRIRLARRGMELYNSGDIEAANAGCPVSGALKGNVDIQVDATLEG